jgi:hypothetical protein
VRKWLFGLFCGVVLMVSTAAAPSHSIDAVLFPGTVTIHDGDEVKTIDGSGDNGMINYNNKAYIPLRAFAEGMGATVAYTPPSESNGVLKIDIFQGDAPIRWSLERTDLTFSQVCRGYPFYIVPSQAKVNGEWSNREFHIHFHNLMEDDIFVRSIELTLEIK